MDIKGIDVSAYNGTIDCAKVAAAGIKVAILRITERGNGTDSTFEHNYSGFQAAGVCVGVYKYSYALTTAQAKEEASKVLEVLNGRQLEFPVFYDVEWAQQRVLGASAITKIIKAFRKVIVDGGYLFGIYCNEDWYNNVLDTASLPYDYWLASYPYNDRGVLVESLRPDVGIGWQYSSKGTINGISGHVDLDVFYKYFEIRPASDYFTYVVQAGDTLSEIALLYGVTVEELALLNEIVDIDLILVGQELKIPVKQYEAWVGECTGNGVNVRRGPGTEYLPIEGYPYLNKGNLVDVIGESRSTLGVLWYYVWIAKKYKGYVRSDYIQKI